MKSEIDMTSGNLFKKMLMFSIPLALTSMLQLLYNAADLIVCGSFGSSHSVAAISGTGSLINLIINLFMGLSVGANVLIARSFGVKDKEKAQRIMYTSLIFSVVFGILVGAFGAIFSKYFLEWMKTPEDVIDLSTDYLRIYFYGLPFLMIYNFGAAILRGLGDTKRPFISLVIAGVINVLMNLLFVIAFKMDVEGVALATIISEAISALLIFIILYKNKGFLNFKFKELRFYKKEAIEIAKIGIPSGLQGVVFSLSNVLIQSSVNSLGTLVMDGNGASASLEGFIYVALNSVSQACVAFVSANYGAMKKENIKKTIIYSYIIVIIMNIIVGGLILGLQNQLIPLYIKDPNAISAAKERLMVIGITYFLCGFMDIMSSAVRGIGYSVTPMIITLIGACGLRIVWIYTLFQIPQMHNLFWLAGSYPISWLITTLAYIVVFTILFRRINFIEDEKVQLS